MIDLAWIGVSVAQRRAELGLSQGALAQLAGLSRATVNSLERGTVADLSVRRLGRLLQVLGAHLQLVPDAARAGATADGAALQLAAQTAGVSYRQRMPPMALAEALATGDMPHAFVPHISTLLDEAPAQVVVAAVEAAARLASVPPAQIWKHVGRWARELQSPRKEWHGL